MAKIRELYIHVKSVLNGRYDDPKVGTEVRIAEERGDEGPQASSVKRVGKQGRHFQKTLKKAS